MGLWGWHRLIQFRCGTGTMFDPLSSVCVHSHPSVCISASKPPFPSLPYPPPSPVRPGGSPPVSANPPGMTMPLVPVPWPPRPPVFPTQAPPTVEGGQDPNSRPIITLPCELMSACLYLKIKQKYHKELILSNIEVFAQSKCYKCSIC